MSETRETSTATIASLDPKIREALVALATQHGLSGDLADTVACCATTFEGSSGLLGKIFGGSGSKRSAAVLTRDALLWAVATGDDVHPNGGRLRDLELRPISEIPHPDAHGLNVYGLLFRGAAERAAAYIALGHGEASTSFQNAVAEALKIGK